MQTNHLTPTSGIGFARDSFIALLMFAFVCATASAQDTLDELSGEKATLIQQEATITTFGEKGVVLELLVDDGVIRKVELAGPRVLVNSLLGEAFTIDDINSPSVGGVLGEDDVTFFGDLTLSSSKWDEQAPNHFQVHVYDALVELRTVQISEADSVKQVFQRPERSLDREVPLNQQGDFIRSIKEQAKKRRNS